MAEVIRIILPLLRHDLLLQGLCHYRDCLAIRPAAGCNPHGGWKNAMA